MNQKTGEEVANTVGQFKPCEVHEDGEQGGVRSSGLDRVRHTQAYC